MEPAAEEVCTYCLEKITGEKCTSDHVIADSWYSLAAEKLERWQVPACRTCNHKFGKMERDAFVRFAACLDGNNPAYKDIVARAKRSMDADQGKNEQDARHRGALLRKIKAAVIEAPASDAEGVLPFFKQNFEAGARHVIKIPQEILEEISRKWVRGLYRLRYGELLSLDAKIDIHYLTDEGASEAFGELLPHMEAFNRGPDIQVLVVRVKDDGHEAFIASFCVWQEYKVYCAVRLGAEAAT